MPHDDAFYLGHMLDTTLNAVKLFRGANHKDYEESNTMLEA